MSIDLGDDHLYALVKRIEETFPVRHRYDFDADFVMYRIYREGSLRGIAVVSPSTNTQVLRIDTPMWFSHGTLIESFDLHPIGLSLLRSTLAGFASLTPAE
jgi:hypothetical protein